MFSDDEEQSIIYTFNRYEAKVDFTVLVSCDQIKEKNYSFSAGQYYDVKIEYTDITPKVFATKMNTFKQNLDSLLPKLHTLEDKLKKQLGGLEYEQ